MTDEWSTSRAFDIEGYLPDKLTLEATSIDVSLLKAMAEAVDAAAFSPELIESEAVIALDAAGPASNSLVQVGSSTKPPWRFIAHLLLVASDGARGVGTAFLITRSILLTAGHNLFFRSRQAPPAELHVFPGRNGDKAFAHYTLGASDTRVTDAWKMNGDITADYGLIRLPEPIGDKLGWFGVGDIGSASPPITMAGYPSEFALGSLFRGDGALVGVSQHRLKYGIDTAGGQSGGPVWDSTSTYRAVALHTQGAGVYGIGIRLTEAVRAQIKEWLSS